MFASPSSSSSSSSSPLRTKRSTKSKKLKKNSPSGIMKESLPSRSGNKAGAPLSKEELAEHVSNEYMHGSGGMLRDLDRKRSDFESKYRKRPSHNNNKGTPTSSSSSTQQSVVPTTEQKVTCGHNDDFAEAIRNLDRHPALVLNADYQPLSNLPLSMWHWQEAVKAVFSGKVTVVDVYPDVVIRAATLRIPLPSVIALSDYVSPQVLHHQPAFTKRNVFLRDVRTCCYCCCLHFLVFVRENLGYVKSVCF